MNNKQDKKVNKEMQSLKAFENKTLKEMWSLIESCLRTTYSTGAYDAIKELHDKRYEKEN